MVISFVEKLFNGLYVFFILIDPISKPWSVP
ncbi:Uncharacterised protein [Vibrio cholerae]|nr:Uncharacterised protein [Vibrio cholerae]